jgi:hypothetical protein
VSQCLPTTHISIELLRNFAETRKVCFKCKHCELFFAHAFTILVQCFTLIQECTHSGNVSNFAVIDAAVEKFKELHTDSRRCVGLVQYMEYSLEVLLEGLTRLKDLFHNIQTTHLQVYFDILLVRMRCSLMLSGTVVGKL